MKMYRIEFEYADLMSRYQWRTQTGYFWGATVKDALEKCIEVYGLGRDCDYRIVDMQEV
jgi:hypothetical protein